MKGKELLRGKATSKGVVVGVVRVVDNDPKRKAAFKQGEIYVADFPVPEDNIHLKKAAAIVTNKGGRTSHATVVARSWGIPAVVGAPGATEALQDGQMVMVDGDAGIVYEYIGAPPAPPPAAPPKSPIADKLAALSKAKGIDVDPESRLGKFLAQHRKKE